MSENIEARIKSARVNQENGVAPEVHIFPGQGHGFDRDAEIRRWDLMRIFLSTYL